MIGRFGGGPVKATTNEMLVLVFLIFIPIGIAFTSGGILGAGVYLAIIFGFSIIYNFSTKKKTMGSFDRIMANADDLSHKSLRYSLSSHRRRIGDFVIIKIVVVGNTIAIYYRLNDGREVKESISRENCESIKYSGDKLTVKFKEQADSKFYIELEIE